MELACLQSLLTLPRRPEALVFEHPLHSCGGTCAPAFDAVVREMEAVGYAQWKRLWQLQAGHDYVGDEVLDNGAATSWTNASTVRTAGCAGGRRKRKKRRPMTVTYMRGL